MKTLEPKRWWFPTVFLVALAIAGMLLARHFLQTNQSPYEDTRGWLIAFLLWGAGVFPIGIPGCLIWSREAFADYGIVFAFVGWGVYGLIILAGLIKPIRWLFIVLVILLFLNIAGCQLDHVYGWMG
jgi:hypothetical protein